MGVHRIRNSQMILTCAEELFVVIADCKSSKDQSPLSLG
jgi:hypothetical protein